ncbi:monooxygenase 2-like isoform X2 [Telopea speciosissima]|uniref:monooxygenase 2-like isoform X2 n=1 Tax=Telopea speciosissima TaxID=54955 RepID=UPI001CC7BAA8|nr:monooxygenase 2-like isoform X2 [Telopea speciosissima]
MKQNVSMAITISTALLLHSPVSPCSFPPLHFRARTRPICFSLVEVRPNVQKEDIVVVGAGIAGLATALSLHRLGVRSLVLEQAESLRTSGTSLTLFKNGWSVLDAIGVADELRTQFLEIQGMVVKSEDGRKLRSFKFKEEAEGQEVRAVERRILLETLANRLPSDSICFSSKLAKIEKTGTGETLLELVDGTQLLAKVVIGCDGIRSPIAKWMGFSEPHYAGHCAYRGLGFYPNGQPFEPNVNYVYGRGLRAGFVPVSPTKVYWFICFNSPSPGPRIDDPFSLKKEAREMIKGWPSELLNVIDMSAEDTLSRTPLTDRWLWPIISPSASADGVVLVGDAWHPMTPNLGQGGCCALEDAIVLSRKLAGALKSGHTSVDDALRLYTTERWPRIFPLTIRANLVGALLQWENPVVCDIRNSIVVPKLVRLRPLLEHTNFTFEPLN